MNEDIYRSRNLEDIDSLLELAKVSETTLHPVTQCLRFSDPLFPFEGRLLQLSKDQVSALEKGEELYFRGDTNDFAVFCGNTSSFVTKEVETSNTFLLAPNLQICHTSRWNDFEDIATPRSFETVDIIGTYSQYLELRLHRPSWLNLIQYLRKTSFKGAEYESESDTTLSNNNDLGSRVLWDDLLSVAQCSEGELVNWLKFNPVCLLNGCYRWLDFDYLTRVTTAIINVIEENSWDWRQINYNDIMSTLCDLEPESVLKYWLMRYASEPADDGVCSLKEVDFVCLFAEILLRPANQMNYEEFLEVWQESVPDGMKTDKSKLIGLAVIDETCRPKTIKYLPLSELPNDVVKRLEILFGVRSKWTLDEIAPYMVEFTNTAKLADVGSLLLKHARSVVSNGIKYFIAR